MASEFNTNAIWKITSTTGNETMSLSAFNGASSLVVFRKGTESRKPFVKISLPTAGAITIMEILKELLGAQPGVRLPYVQNQYNSETRSFEQGCSLVFCKDERRCYSIELTNRQITTPIKFIFKIPKTFSTGSDMTDEQRSQCGVKEFITYLDKMLPVALMLSRQNMENMSRSRNNNNNRQNNYRPSESAIPMDDESVFG